MSIFDSISMAKNKNSIFVISAIFNPPPVAKPSTVFMPYWKLKSQI